MEMDMSNPMNELDKLASGLEKLSIRQMKEKRPEETISLEDAVENSEAEKSREFLQEAHGIVYGDRHEEYGDAADNFTDIAKMWTDWMSFHFNKEDVAMMMIMVKIARCHHKWTEDSLKDIVGYCTILHRFKFLDE